MKKIIFTLIAIATYALPLQSHAVTDQEVNMMTSYAVFIGRGYACGVNTEPEAKRVGEWLERVLVRGSEDYELLVPIFFASIQNHANLQNRGETPDNCDTFKKQYKDVYSP